MRDVISTAKKLMRDAAQYDDVTEIREKVEDLKDTVDSVSRYLFSLEHLFVCYMNFLTAFRFTSTCSLFCVTSIDSC